MGIAQYSSQDIEEDLHALEREEKEMRTREGRRKRSLETYRICIEDRDSTTLQKFFQKNKEEMSIIGECHSPHSAREEKRKFIPDVNLPRI